MGRLLAVSHRLHALRAALIVLPTAEQPRRPRWYWRPAVLNYDRSDRTEALRELRRVVRPTGALVLSRQHPTGVWLRHGGNYFDVRVIEEVWSRGWQVRYWLAPLERTCEELHEAGFLIERLHEPRPTAAAADIDRDDYERLTREPTDSLRSEQCLTHVIPSGPVCGCLPMTTSRTWLTCAAHRPILFT